MQTPPSSTRGKRLSLQPGSATGRWLAAGARGCHLSQSSHQLRLLSCIVLPAHKEGSLASASIGLPFALWCHLSVMTTFKLFLVQSVELYLAELPVPPTAGVALSSMAAFVPCLKFMIFSDWESFTLLWELSCLSSTAAVCLCMLLVPFLFRQGFMVLLHRNQGTCMFISRCYWYSLRNIAPDWPFIFFFKYIL